MALYQFIVSNAQLGQLTIVTTKNKQNAWEFWSFKAQRKENVSLRT